MRSYIRGTIAVALIAFLLQANGCSSTPTTSTGPSLWEAIQGILSNEGVQALLDLKSQTEATRNINTVIDKFSDANLNWIKAELIAVARISKQLGIPLEQPVNLTPEQITWATAVIADTENRYINRYGWMSLDPLGPTAEYTNENPTFFMAQYVWLLKRLGLLTQAMKDKYVAGLKSQITEMELQPGLHDRFAKPNPRPVEINPFSHDENQGLAHLDSLFDFQLGVGKAQNDFGKRYDYVYMNSAWSALDKFDRPMLRNGQPITKAKMLVMAQRYGGQVEVIRRTGGDAPSTGSDLLLCVDLLTSLRDDCSATSTPILNLMRTKFLMGQSEILDGCIYQFNALAQRHFARGKTCGGKVVETDNAFTAMARIYYNLPERHPIDLLSTLLPPGAG